MDDKKPTIDRVTKERVCTVQMAIGLTLNAAAGVGHLSEGWCN